MKQVKHTLTVLFWTALTLAVTIVIVYETDVLETGLLTSASTNSEFIATTMMELLTLASVPLALKLFHFRKVHNDLVTRKADALRCWGLLRLGLLMTLLIINTLLYYIYMKKTAFGYMALILVICLPFVYPSMDRCLTETGEYTGDNEETIGSDKIIEKEE